MKALRYSNNDNLIDPYARSHTGDVYNKNNLPNSPNAKNTLE